MFNFKSEDTKRYLVSSALTFFAGFALVLSQELPSLSYQAFQDGALVGIIFTAVRTGIKMVFERSLSLRRKKK